MLTKTIETNEWVTTAHRAKLAYVYVRQSTTGQVRQHQESTELQYRLVNRAVSLGWPRDRIEVIDEDLGKSGMSSEAREGFQRLIAEIGLAKAGLVLSLDASRLARNNRDWHQLLELCSLFGVLIADGERLYDPRAYHDRLLLGLSGIMSEAELHQIQVRLHQGERQKAARGELRMPLPAGLARNSAGAIVLNPDEEVQARIRLVFAEFRKLQSAKGVTMALRRADLQVPVRPIIGPAPHEVVWREANTSRILQILKNPTYAGAYVYGRRRQDPCCSRPGATRRGTIAVALEDWPICLREAHIGYISWGDFMANQKRLADNVIRYDADRPGVARRGSALLQGIVLCGRCGRHMSLHYSGLRGDYPVYRCATDRRQTGQPSCQEVRAMAVDNEVERLILEAIRPDQIALAIATMGHLEEEVRQLERQWSMKRERARYEAERARRQYDAVEPENRLVARSLERQWEERLRHSEEIEHAYERWRSQQAISITEADRNELAALADNVPQIWHASTTTAADRKQILRILIRNVVLDQKRALGLVWIKVIWQTGATSEHSVRRSVQSYRQHSDLSRLRQRIGELNAESKMDAEIATILNREGFVPARGQSFSGESIFCLRKQWNIRTVKINGSGENPDRWPDGSYSVRGAAEALGITGQTVFKWLRKGRLVGEQLAKGMPWQISLSKKRIAELSGQVRRAKRSKKEAS
jgi:DNA invertase Pin-like site-specific DNA recombinase